MNSIFLERYSSSVFQTRCAFQYDIDQVQPPWTFRIPLSSFKILVPFSNLCQPFTCRYFQPTLNLQVSFAKGQKTSFVFCSKGGAYPILKRFIFFFCQYISWFTKKTSDYLFLTLTEIQEIKKTSPLPSIYQDRTFNTCGTEPNSVRLCDEQMKSHHMQLNMKTFVCLALSKTHI